MSSFRLLCCGLVLVACCSTSAAAEETKTILGPDTDMSFVWGVDVKVNSIQEQTGTLLEIYGGTRIGRSTVVALAGGLNVSHPDVNYGYLGLLGQYTFKPEEAIHYGGQLLVGTGTTRDYEEEKSSLFDNYGNISGPRFFLIEPAVSVEANLTASTKLILSLGYRIVTGLDEDHELISTTRVTSDDLSGLNLMLGVQFGS